MSFSSQRCNEPKETEKKHLNYFYETQKRGWHRNTSQKTTKKQRYNRKFKKTVKTLDNLLTLATTKAATYAIKSRMRFSESGNNYKYTQFVCNNLECNKLEGIHTNFACYKLGSIKPSFAFCNFAKLSISKKIL